MITAKQFNAACRRTIAASQKNNQQLTQLHEIFQERYGVVYNDLDIDELVDCFEYGAGGYSTMAEIDEIMTRNGHPPKEDAQ